MRSRLVVLFLIPFFGIGQKTHAELKQEQQQLDQQLVEQRAKIDSLCQLLVANRDSTQQQIALLRKENETLRQIMIGYVQQIDQLNNETEDCKNKLAAEEQYKLMIQEADAAFSKKDFASAKQLYSRALAIKFGDPYPIEKIRQIESLTTSEPDNSPRMEQIKKLSAVGDEYFKQKDYIRAKEYYQEVLKLYAADDHATKRIKEIDAILNKQ